METLPELDALIASAWPPATEEHFDGWTFRYTSGVTRRANSVLALNEPTDMLAAVVAAEAFYERHGLPATFMFSDASSPDALSATLVDRGYVSSATTCVLSASAEEAAAALVTEYAGRFITSHEPSDDWFATYWTVEAATRFPPSARKILREVLLTPAAPARFVSALREDRVESVGQVVIQQGWGCIQCVATAPWARRQGAGAAVVAELIAAARQGGAERVFACVTLANAPSLKLFERAGFELSHQYSYYVPAPD